MERTVIVNHTINLFNERGIRFSVDDLAKRIKMSKKTLYKEFGSKENLITEVVKSLFSSIRSQEKTILANERRDIVERLKDILCLFPTQQINFAHMADIQLVYPQVYKLILSELQDNWENTLTVLEMAIQQERIHPIDPENLRILLLGLFTELLTRDEAEQKKRTRECVDILFTGYEIPRH
ncbi:MAG: TetR/AcrR family transcriptional regulator [Spirochaetales bacterium]|nr:TetR/AcrR family transcriptional regulator [Spirochaetales bacterium]